MLAGIDPERPRGGVHAHVAGLAQALAARGIAVDVHAPGSRERTVPLGGARVIVHRSEGAWGLVRAGAAISRAVEAGGYDLVHLHDAYPPLSNAALRLARSHPLVLTLHNLQSDFTHGSALRRGFRATVICPLLARALAVAHRVIVCSPAMERSLRPPGRAKTVVVPNGVDPARFDVAPERLDGTPSVLFLGMLDARKGIEDLLDAWPIVSEAFPTARLHVAGEGDRANAIRERARRLDGVELLGYIGEERKAALLRGADIVVAPSRVEPFGIVALEAMAAGAPLVTTRVGGLPFAVGDSEAAVFVEPLAPSQLAREIVALAREPARRQRMAAAGPARARELAWPRIAALTEEVYALARGPAGASAASPIT